MEVETLAFHCICCVICFVSCFSRPFDTRCIGRLWPISMDWSCRCSSKRFCVNQWPDLLDISFVGVTCKLHRFLLVSSFHPGMCISVMNHPTGKELELFMLIAHENFSRSPFSVFAICVQCIEALFSGYLANIVSCEVLSTFLKEMEID